MRCLPDIGQDNRFQFFSELVWIDFDFPTQETQGAIRFKFYYFFWILKGAGYLRLSGEGAKILAAKV